MFRTGLLVVMLLSLSAAEVMARPPKRTPVGVPLEVVGYGANADEARNNALKNAAEEAKVRLDLMQKLGIIEMSEPSPSALLKGQELVAVRLRLEFTGELLVANEAANKAITAQGRQWMLARVVLGMVVAFGLVAAYLRLEEWTKGYATRVLRFLVVLIAFLTAVVLWLMG